MKVLESILYDGWIMKTSITFTIVIFEKDGKYLVYNSKLDTIIAIVG